MMIFRWTPQLPTYDDRYYDFEDDVPAHIIDASPAGHGIFVGIFQAVQVVLVGFIEQVVGCDVALSYLLAFHQNVGAGREVEQGVARCLGFGLVGTVDVGLPQIAVEVEGDEEVVEQ